ncbi:MAG: TadE/TadG family type IV pilus assembly protein [Pseudomonadota bacterium]
MSKRFLKDDQGSSTIEFIIVFAIYFGFVFSIIDIGWYMVKVIQLERGVDLVTRELRLGLIDDPTYDTVLDKVCEETGILDDCTQNVVIQSQIMQANATPQDLSPLCFDPSATPDEQADFDPSEGFSTGVASDQVLFTICAKIKPILASGSILSILPTFDDGHLVVTSRAGFLNEP